MSIKRCRDENAADDTLLLHSRTIRCNLHISDIVYVEGYNRQLTFHMKNGTISVSGRLSEVEAALEPTVFLRVHQGFFVNMNCIRKLRKNMVLLEDGSQIFISTRRLKNVRLAYTQFQAELPPAPQAAKEVLSL